MITRKNLHSYTIKEPVKNDKQCAGYYCVVGCHQQTATILPGFPEPLTCLVQLITLNKSSHTGTTTTSSVVTLDLVTVTVRDTIMSR